MPRKVGTTSAEALEDEREHAVGRVALTAPVMSTLLK